MDDQQPVQCKNCFKHFTPTTNQDGVCLYHPGNAVEFREYRARQNYPGQQIPDTPQGIQNFPKAFRWACCLEEYLNGKPGSGCRKGSHVEPFFGEAFDSITRVAHNVPEPSNKRKMTPTAAAPIPTAKRAKVSKIPTAIQVVKIIPTGANLILASAQRQMSSVAKPARIPQRRIAGAVKPVYKADPGVVKAEKQRANLLGALVMNRLLLCDVCNCFRPRSEFPTTKGGKPLESATICSRCCGEGVESDISVGEGGGGDGDDTADAIM